MDAELVAVEQLNGLLHTVQELEAAGMDLSGGKNAALATGLACAAADLVTGQNDGAADMKAAGRAGFPLGNQGKAAVCRADCHTSAEAAAAAPVVFDGGEGVERERGAALYDILGRSKFIHIAQGAPVGRKQPRTCKNRPQKKEGAAAVMVVVVGAASVAAWGKSLLGREKRSGAICAVRLTRHGAKATQFTTGQVLSCTPTGPHEFEYEGGKAA